MLKVWFFLSSIAIYLFSSVGSMAMEEEPFENGRQIVSSQPLTEHPGLSSYKAGGEALKKFGIIIREDGTSDPCKPQLMWQALKQEDLGASILDFFRESNRLGYAPARGILLWLLPHASGIYMEQARLEMSPVAFLMPFLMPLCCVPPQIILPSRTGSLPYGSHVCGVHKALENHYRLLLEKESIIEQVLNSDAPSTTKTLKEKEKEAVFLELQKTSKFMGRSSCVGFSCSMLMCVGLPAVFCEDSCSTLCGKYFGPKDHLTQEFSLSSGFKQNSLKEKLLNSEG